jgi:hypothetical protein
MSGTSVCHTLIAATALAALAGLTGFARAQCSANNGNYVITQTSGGAIVPGTTDLGNHCDDCSGAPNSTQGTVGPAVPLPFPFTFYGTAYSSVIPCSNGHLEFASPAATAFGNACLPTTTFTPPTMMPFWDDLRTDLAGSGIFSSITGVAPNRIFNMEWRATFYTGGESVDFEVRLYEGSTRFDFVYGSMSAAGGSGATMGCQQAGPAGSRNTQFACNTSVNNAPAAGTVLSFDCAVTAAPSCQLTATPATAAPGDTITFHSIITPGTPASPPYTVTIDGSPINAGIVQLFDDGNPAHGDAVANDNIFSNIVTVGAGAANGPATVVGTVTDSASPQNSSTCGAAVTIGTVSLGGIGTASPSSTLPGNPILLRVNVTPATGPASTNIQVHADLSTIGGSSTAQLFDDGSNGDATPGDHIFSLSYNIPAGTMLGNYILPFSIQDDQGRSADGSMTLYLGYCSVTTLNTVPCSNTTYEYIANVTMDAINDSEDCSANHYPYMDQTALVANVDPTAGAAFSITVGNYWGGDEVTVFIDWNNNGTLNDPGESYVLTSGGGTGSGGSSMSFNTTIVPPAGALPGPHRMRVWLTFAITPTPCLSGQTYGQIKDYTASIGGGGSTGSCCVLGVLRVGGNQCHENVSQADCAAMGGAWHQGQGCFSPSGDQLCGRFCGSLDFNCDGASGTDADIEAFFACLSGSCPPAPCVNNKDFNGDGASGTDSDIEAFFYVLSNGQCPP